MAVKIRAEARLQEGAAAELRRLREENAKLREMLRQALVDFAHVDGLKSEAMRAETARRESAEALLRHWDAYSDVEAHFARYAKASPDASPPDAPGSP